MSEQPLMVPMRDGVCLRTEVFLPEGDGPFPTLVNRYPYSPVDGVWAMLGRVMAMHGYATVVQHVRGRYGSEGDFNPQFIDVDDGYDTVEWAAAQPWSNGRVGMYGVSYSGMSQWAAAAARPPHLLALAPLSSPWDRLHGGWYWSPGVMALGLALHWSTGMTVWEAERRGLPHVLPAMAEAERRIGEAGFADVVARDTAVALTLETVEPLLRRWPLRDLPELELAPWFREMCDHPEPTDLANRQLDASLLAHDLDLPVFHLTGWYDFFLGGSLSSYAGMSRFAPSAQTRAAQRLTIGPWNHSARVPRPDADPAVEMLLDLAPDSSLMRFLALHVKGEQNGAEHDPPVRVYVMGANRWRTADAWPLPGTVFTPWYLHSDGAANTMSGNGSLSVVAPGDEPADTFVYDPSNPVPGPMALGDALNDPVDRNEVGKRNDVLVYTTPPLDTDVEIVGPITLELFAASSVSATSFAAKLIDVFPDGTAVPLTQGVVLTSPAGHTPPTPGSVLRLELDLWATGNLFAAGHRIRLDVSSSEYPTFELCPNTGGRITHDSNAVSATQRVFHDSLHPSRLVLPVVPVVPTC